MEITLSVIIVNYNGQRYLDACFASIAKQLQGIPYEIVVTDNKSADGSCAYIKEHYPNVILIESPDNLGFGKGNNVAVKRAKGKYILLLNNDTILQSHLAPALAVLKNNDNVGALGINMLNGEGHYLKAAGNLPSPFNLFRIKNIMWLGPEFKKGIFSKEIYEVGWITGSFMLMPKQVYDSIGGFDEDYFMYVEDVDLCKKIANAGYKRIFMPQLNYLHFVGYNSSKDHLILRGYDTYINKHTRGIYKVLMRLSLGINKLVKKVKKLR
ncbi:glycosyltransferase family 2 protein [Flavobacterium psychrotrophum]|uniref:glycosyltransferase family 2 protein n=1 Tax=Flavobacterium psychrotrophum TaxID=2294119 RepID=UPI000E321E49|nr:glycosyltransferase family 2 protein [Flavobacterium psychrotrophum]